MDYLKLHDEIIKNARNNNRSKKTGIYELHHIIMRSVGGDDTEENTVLFTPKEHFLVHFLLWKIHPDDRRYRDPIFMFKHKGGVNSRLYDAARKAHILFMRSNNPSQSLSDDSRKSKSEKLKNRTFSKEHRERISASRKGTKSRQNAVLSNETKKSISDSLKLWYKENKISEDTKRKLSEAKFGKTHTKESIDRMRIIAVNRPKYVCGYCNRSFDGGNFNQHMIRIHKWTSEMSQTYKQSDNT